uniref:Uncharacterized protein n=1 Tax=Podarcis muralis TaxID=64176 RepID=A0A670JV33_PODMU
SLLFIMTMTDQHGLPPESGLITLFVFIGIGGTGLCTMRLALCNPDVSNPEPWNKLNCAALFQFYVVNADYDKLKKGAPRYRKSK